jgi:hypothetical protein
MVSAGIGRQLRRDDLAVRQVDGAGNVAGGVFSAAAYIEQHEARIFAGQRVMHVPAVGLELERRFEVG